MKRLPIIGFVLVLIGVIGYSCEIAKADGYYDRITGEIWLSDDATPFDVAHENAHKFYFETMNQGERNRWEAQFTRGSLNYCYSLYAHTFGRPLDTAVECFADLYAYIQGNSVPAYDHQQWFGYDGRDSKEYLAVLSLLNIK